MHPVFLQGKSDRVLSWTSTNTPCRLRPTLCQPARCNWRTDRNWMMHAQGRVMHAKVTGRASQGPHSGSLAESLGPGSPALLTVTPALLYYALQYS